MCVEQRCLPVAQRDNLAQLCPPFIEKIDEREAADADVEPEENTSEPPDKILPSTCLDGQQQTCQTNKEAPCEKGQQTCQKGKWGPCVPTGQPEICDELDNDCDGKIDEDDVCLSCPNLPSGSCCTKTSVLRPNTEGNTLITAQLSGEHIVIGGASKQIVAWTNKNQRNYFIWEPAFNKPLKERPSSVLAMFFGHFLAGFSDGSLEQHLNYSSSLALFPQTTDTTWKTDVGCLAYAPGGELVVWCAGKQVGNWNLAKTIRTMGQHTDKVRVVAVHPNETLSASGDDGHNIRLWEMPTGTKYTTLTGHSGAILSLAFSADGKWLVSGSTDATVRVWDLKSKQLSQTFAQPKAAIRKVGFDPTSRVVFAATANGTIYYWEQSTGALLKVYQTAPNEIWGMTFAGFLWNPDLQLSHELISGFRNETNIWHCPAPPLVTSCPANTRVCCSQQQHISRSPVISDIVPSSALSMSSSGKFVALIGRIDGSKGPIEVMDLTKPKSHFSIAEELGSAGIQFVPGQHQLVVHTASGISIWDVTTKKKQTIAVPALWRFVLHRDGSQILLIQLSTNTAIKLTLWDITSTPTLLQSWEQSLTGFVPQSLSGWTPKSRGSAVWFEQTNHIAIIVPYLRKLTPKESITEEYLYLWKLDTKSIQVSVPQTSLTQNGDKLVISPDAQRKWLAVLGGNARRFDWSIERFVPLPLTSIITDGGAFLTGQILATGSIDRQIRLWDVEQGVLLQQIPGHKLKIEALATSADGKTMASLDAGAIHIWQCKYQP